MTDSKSDIKSLSESLSTPDSEPGEECDSEPDSEVEDASLAPLKPRDSIPFSLSQLSACVPPPPSISEPSQPSISTPHEPSEPPSQRNIDPVTKSIALALFHTLPGTKKERYKEIKKSTGIKREAFRKIIRKAKARGYNFKINKLRIRLEHLIDAPRSGRPNIAYNPENKRQIIAIVTKDRNGREKSGKIIASEVQPPISKQSIYRSLKKLGFKKIKKTTKPDLNDAQKARRLKFYQKYRHWTLEDWKKVI